MGRNPYYFFDDLFGGSEEDEEMASYGLALENDGIASPAGILLQEFMQAHLDFRRGLDDRPIVTPVDWTRSWGRDNAFWRDIVTQALGGLFAGGIAFTAAKAVGFFSGIRWAAVGAWAVATFLILVGLRVIALFAGRRWRATSLYHSMYPVPGARPYVEPRKPYKGLKREYPREYRKMKRQQRKILAVWAQQLGRRVLWGVENPPNR